MIIKARQIGYKPYNNNTIIIIHYNYKSVCRYRFAIIANIFFTITCTAISVQHRV